MNNKSFYKNIILASVLAGTSLTSANALAASTLTLEFDQPGDLNYKTTTVNFSVDKSGKFISNEMTFSDQEEFGRYVYEQNKTDSHTYVTEDVYLDPTSSFNLFSADTEATKELVDSFNNDFDASITTKDFLEAFKFFTEKFEEGHSEEEITKLALKDPSLNSEIKSVLSKFMSEFEGESEGQTSNESKESTQVANLFSGSSADSIKNQIQKINNVSNSNESRSTSSPHNRVPDLPQNLQRVQKALNENLELRKIISEALLSEGLDGYIRNDDVELLQAIADSGILEEYVKATVDNGTNKKQAKEKAKKGAETIKAEITKVADVVKSDENYKKKVTEKLKNLVENSKKEDLPEAIRKVYIERVKKTIGDPAKAKDVKSVANVAQPDNYTTHGMIASSQASSAVITGRVSEIGTISGLSAGDQNMQFGAWLKGTFSTGEQEAYSMEPGYKFNQTGFTIGADTDFGTDGGFILGAAASILNNNVKSKNSGDTDEKISSYIGNIYGLASIGQAYLSGHVQFGKSDINKDRKSGDNDNHVAKGKTKGSIYGGKLEAGYNYLIPSANTIITPSVGIAHNSVSVDGYKETGLGLNRKIAKRDSSRTDALVGLGAKYSIDMESLKVLPEISAGVAQNLSSKNSDTKIYLIDDMEPIITPGQKLNKTSYNVGAALNILSGDSIEARFAYDLGMAKKFKSHTGSVKLRVSF